VLIWEWDLTSTSLVLQSDSAPGQKAQLPKANMNAQPKSSKKLAKAVRCFRMMPGAA
jgi:hypothetical protein